MALGYAKLTNITQHFLDTCPAVRTWWHVREDCAFFEFDESLEVYDAPCGVYFDASSILDCHADLLDAIRATTSDSLALSELCEKISAGEQDIDLKDFSERLGLAEGWDWSDLDARILRGDLTYAKVDAAIHAGLS